MTTQNHFPALSNQPMAWNLDSSKGNFTATSSEAGYTPTSSTVDDASDTTLVAPKEDTALTDNNMMHVLMEKYHRALADLEKERRGRKDQKDALVCHLDDIASFCRKKTEALLALETMKTGNSMLSSSGPPDTDPKGPNAVGSDSAVVRYAINEHALRTLKARKATKVSRNKMRLNLQELEKKVESTRAQLRSTDLADRRVLQELQRTRLLEPETLKQCEEEIAGMYMEDGEAKAMLPAGQTPSARSSPEEQAQASVGFAIVTLIIVGVFWLLL